MIGEILWTGAVFAAGWWAKGHFGSFAAMKEKAKKQWADWTS